MRNAEPMRLEHQLSKKKKTICTPLKVIFVTAQLSSNEKSTLPFSITGNAIFRISQQETRFYERKLAFVHVAAYAQVIDSHFKENFCLTLRN